MLLLLCVVLMAAASTADGRTTLAITLPKQFTFLTPAGRRRLALKSELFELVRRSSPAGNNAGAFDREEDGDRFREIFCAELPALNPTPDPARSPLFSGEWECAWTSEKEINLLVRSGLFGDRWRRTYQVIDVPGGRLSNYLAFDNDGEFRVGSTIAPDPAVGSRFNFQFDEGLLAWKGLIRLSVPPVGSGWGELLYLDEDIRLQRDIRGDLLLARRV